MGCTEGPARASGGIETSKACSLLPLSAGRAVDAQEALVKSTRVYSPWPPPEEKSAEWFFQLFDALDAVAALLRPSRSKRIR
jgi:hypothetical protein